MHRHQDGTLTANCDCQPPMDPLTSEQFLVVVLLSFAGGFALAWAIFT